MYELTRRKKWKTLVNNKSAFSIFSDLRAACVCVWAIEKCIMQMSNIMPFENDRKGIREIENGTDELHGVHKQGALLLIDCCQNIWYTYTLYSRDAWHTHTIISSNQHRWWNTCHFIKEAIRAPEMRCYKSRKSQWYIHIFLWNICSAFFILFAVCVCVLLCMKSICNIQIQTMTALASNSSH